jgi:hypothetical protein
MENGNRKITADDLSKLSTLFGVSADELLNNEQMSQPATMFARSFEKLDEVHQEEILNLVTEICEIDFKFDNFLDVSNHFKKMINLCKQMNYSVYKSDQYYDFKRQVEAMLADHK